MDPIDSSHEVNVASDRATVWVNAGDGSCIGRFSKRFGIDVHTSASEQLAGKSECLMCLHGPADRAAWLLFVDAMRQHHGIHIPDQLLAWS